MVLPLGAWPHSSVRQSLASQNLPCVRNTWMFVEMDILAPYGCGGPKSLLLKGNAKAD